MQWYIKLYLLFSVLYFYMSNLGSTIRLIWGRKEWRKELRTHNQQDDKSLLKCHIFIRHQDDYYCLIRTVFLNRDEVIYFSSMKSPCGLWRGLVVRNSGSLNVPSPLISYWGHQLSVLLLRPVASVHLPIKHLQWLTLICLDTINFPYFFVFTLYSCSSTLQLVCPLASTIFELQVHQVSAD
jgi:hypothetical protein